jgi:hypothetical protein
MPPSIASSPAATSTDGVGMASNTNIARSRLRAVSSPVTTTTSAADAEPTTHTPNCLKRTWNLGASNARHSNAAASVPPKCRWYTEIDLRLALSVNIVVSGQWLVVSGQWSVVSVDEVIPQ